MILCRLVGNLGWTTSRKYCFSLLFIAVVWAKLLHIYSHLNSLPLGQFLLWGPTFFLQDALCVLVFWGLTRNLHNRWLRILAASIVIPASLGISLMAAANTSFYITTGAEIHWRQARSFHHDFASVKTLLAGLTGLLIVEALYIIASWFTTPFLYNWVNRVLEILGSSFSFRRKSPNPDIYEQVAHDDYKINTNWALSLDASENVTRIAQTPRLARFAVLFPTVSIILLYCIRPSGPAYGFLSDNLLILPFGGSKPHNGHALIDIPSSLGNYSWLENRTALVMPPKFDWLPHDELAGFRDWYARSNDEEPRVHYNPTQDPLHISNLDGEIIEPLRETLQNSSVNIKHIFLLKLESTRDDVFPLRKDSFMHNRIRQSYSGRIPADVEERLAHLTSTAERLTGTPSGFHGSSIKPYGGIHATNSHTTGTMTLKSLTGTICGASPLVVDFNREYLHHIYQPCMPHIFQALNAQSNGPKTDHFTSWPWHSAFMQSITDLYDNQNFLMPGHGFQRLVNSDTLGPSTKTEKFNFWGYPDNELRSYFHDAINKAEKNQERLFLTHLTGITHYPWDMPRNEFVEMVGSTYLPFNKKLRRYLNTIHFADQWLADILEILEDTGVANETLLVVTGDHGITLPEDGGVTPCDNPHISNFHVPLVFAHPQIPPIEIDSPVTSVQILPTILDLLKESSSLDEHATRAIEDLLPMYEGQSIIRPLVPEVEGKQDWQFSTMNTGGTWLALRSAAKPYRLIIPLIPDVEWRFSDISTDPGERHYLISFDLLSLISQVEVLHGSEAVRWVNDAAYVAQWWIAENWRRYEYTP